MPSPIVQADRRCRRYRPLKRALFAALCLALTLPLVGCSNGGIYAGVAIEGPSVDVGSVRIRTGASMGRRF